MAAFQAAGTGSNPVRSTTAAERGKWVGRAPEASNPASYGYV